MGGPEHRALIEVYAAAVSLGLTKRRALLVGFSCDVRASLQSAAYIAEQVLVDLDALNGVESLSSSDLPIAIWLTNALALTKVASRGRRVRAALAALRHRYATCGVL